jgi:hypothetical protein
MIKSCMNRISPNDVPSFQLKPPGGEALKKLRIFEGLDLFDNYTQRLRKCFSVNDSTEQFPLLNRTIVFIAGGCKEFGGKRSPSNVSYQPWMPRAARALGANVINIDVGEQDPIDLESYVVLRLDLFSILAPKYSSSTRQVKKNQSLLDIFNTLNIRGKIDLIQMSNFIDDPSIHELSCLPSPLELQKGLYEVRLYETDEAVFVFSNTHLCQVMRRNLIYTAKNSLKEGGMYVDNLEDWKREELDELLTKKMYGTI